MLTLAVNVVRVKVAYAAVVKGDLALPFMEEPTTEPPSSSATGDPLAAGPSADPPVASYPPNQSIAKSVIAFLTPASLSLFVRGGYRRWERYVWGRLSPQTHKDDLDLLGYFVSACRPRVDLLSISR